MSSFTSAFRAADARVYTDDAEALRLAVTRDPKKEVAFDAVKLAEKVRELGFAEVSDFGPDDVQAHYFAGRTDGLRPFALGHNLRARVGARSS